eukprot:1737771-Karenia_brevis.AAC.1
MWRALQSQRSFPHTCRGSGQQDAMFLKADCSAYIEFAVIDLFKLYTNTGGKGFNGNEASSSDGIFGSEFDDMIDASECATWLMLRNIPRKALVVTHPMQYLSRYTGGQLAEASQHMSMGFEGFAQKHLFYDLIDIMPNESVSSDVWPAFLSAIIQLIPDSMIEDLYNVVDTRSMKKAYRTVYAEYRKRTDMRCTHQYQAQNRHE